jgi:hypothetical protein
MHQSFFSYNITRPYPFRWFTPFVIVGGIIAVVLVSFLNVAANGYELYAIATPNPNATLSNTSWFQKWPSFIFSTNAKCDTATIPLQTRVYTNNTALPYTLSSVWTLDENGRKNISGSLVYNNQPLHRCNMSSEISFDINVDARTGGQMAVMPVGAIISAGVNCAIETNQGRTYFNLVASYDPVPPASEPYSSFLSGNKTSKATLYWGESLMRIYWSNLLMEFFNANVDLEVPWYNGVVSVKRNLTTPIATVQEIQSNDFFHISCYFNKINETGIDHYDSPCLPPNNDISSLSNPKLAFMPGIWPAIDILGKATYYTALADLGRDNSSGPNPLADPVLLADLTKNLTQVANATIFSGSRFDWGIGSIANSSFDPSQAGNISLGISPAVLATNYMCQVPKLKTGGSLFVSVLVADLVLLQALWMICKLVVDIFWIEKRPEWRRCEGCAGGVKDVALVGLVEGRNKSYSVISQQAEELSEVRI